MHIQESQHQRPNSVLTSKNLCSNHACLLKLSSSCHIHLVHLPGRLVGYLMELSTVEGKTQEEASLFRGVLTSFNQNKQNKAWLRDWKGISACQVTFAAVPWYYCEVMR